MKWLLSGSSRALFKSALNRKSKSSSGASRSKNDWGAITAKAHIIARRKSRGFPVKKRLGRNNRESSEPLKILYGHLFQRRAQQRGLTFVSFTAKPASRNHQVRQH